jgi:hypothetical protein
VPIKELQQRLTQVGVIRLGEQRMSKNNKPYPAKLDTFRVTSPSKELVEAVAALYGGQVTAWPDGPGGGQWQVTTKATEIPVHVLPQKIDPNYELWGNGFRSRLCDGETERIRNAPCFCAVDRAETEANGGTWVRDARRHCKPTTRVSVMLSDVPSLGTFKLESHGWNAAAELPTLAMALLNQVHQPVPAILRTGAARGPDPQRDRARRRRSSPASTRCPCWTSASWPPPGRRWAAGWTPYWETPSARARSGRRSALRRPPPWSRMRRARSNGRHRRLTGGPRSPPSRRRPR